MLLLITAAAATDIPSQGRDRAPEVRAAVERVQDALDNLRREDFPLVTQLGAEPRSISGEERFTFPFETFLDGLIARARSNG